MSRSILLLWIVLSFPVWLCANNVRVTRDISVDKDNMTDQFVEINFAIEWENSWRDDFNWDAVYVFLKCRKKGVAEWSHVQLRPSFQKVSNGYDCWVANTDNGSVGQGLFVYRSRNGSGMSTVDVTLQWLYARNSLSKIDFMDDQVEYTAMCIEMVYVPNGVFYAGDNSSKNTLQSAYRPILEKWDLINLNSNLKFDADGTVEAQQSYPPQNAANHVNMNSVKNIENAWYATQTAARWQVTFPSEVTVKWFGVSGVAGYPAPTAWQLMGRKTGADWNILFEGVAADWPVGPADSYPVSKALSIDAPMACTEYMIKVITASGRVALNNISMTDQDLSKATDYAFVIDNNNTTIPLNSTSRGMFANDKDTWNTTLAAAYPSGYFGFYVMKYEMSQEQYVKYLNKLSLTQQKQRTIGGALTDLSVGDFVYGDPKWPTCRNGIAVVSASSDGSPVVFGNNGNSTDEAMSQADDGLTIACNFLSPEDMLAYADWTGLRPMSELEYEKAARASFPDLPEQGEWAWGSSDKGSLTPSSTLNQAGTASEKLDNKANVNYNKNFSGPVRCGSFASQAASQIEAGASYWGVLELSGNLAEICYCVNTKGRGFQGISAAHGNGALNAAGKADVSTSYWPVDPQAFAIRGGSFISNDLEIAVSDRSQVMTYTDINHKDSLSTFRLAHSFGQLQTVKPITYLTLENGLSALSDGGALDTVCSGSTYTIGGSDLLASSTMDLGTRKDVRLNYKGRCEFVWYISENGGATWNIIPGEREIGLTYDKFVNDASAARTVWVRRLAITPEYTSMSPYVKLNVINSSFISYPSLQRDTIQVNNAVKGCLVETKTPALFTWRWKGQGQATAPLQATTTVGQSNFYTPSRADFNNVSGTSFTVQCEIRTQKCVETTDFDIYVQPRPKTAVLSSEISIDGTDPLKECGVMMMDARDDDGLYGTVRIDDQCWMSENLRHAVQGVTYRQPSDPDGKKLGSFYVWGEAVKNDACPSGWSMPTIADVNKLKNFLNSDGYARAGLKMKAGNAWAVTLSNRSYWGINSSGFSAVGAGRYSEMYVGRYAYFLLDGGYYFWVDNEAADFTVTTSVTNLGMSIRCIRDFSK